MFFQNEMPTLLTNSSLKKQLRDLEGIPNANYVVENERVFVFNALVNEVQKLSEHSANQSLEELARQAMPNVWVSAIEATSQWGIVPIPYEKVEVDGHLAIRHKPFNALLPGRYVNESDRVRDLASLLLGQTISGEGEFVFEGQPMSLRQSLAPSLLPPRPVLEEIDGLERFESEPSFNYLLGLTYQLGFAALPKDWFDGIQKLESEWTSFNSRLKKVIYLKPNLQLIWSFTDEISWTQWNETVAEQEAQEDLHQLRQDYRELHTMPDGALYWLFDSFQRDCCSSNGWTASRDEEFFFFLLGQLCTPRDTDGKEALPVGEFVGYELLRGQSLEKAVEAGKLWFVYNESISSLAYRVSEIVNFLRSRPDANKRGEPIFTFGDWFESVRKAEAFAMTVDQSPSELF